jgi:hypothetical protein
MQRRGIVYDVYIRFLDGGTLRFRAREFNINVVGRLSPEQKPKRFTYTDTNGQQTPIYLRLDQVAAIVVTPAGASSNQP